MCKNKNLIKEEAWFEQRLMVREMLFYIGKGVVKD